MVLFFLLIPFTLKTLNLIKLIIILLFFCGIGMVYGGYDVSHF